MKIILLVPDGVGVRNYLFSSFTSNLIKNNNDVLIYHKLTASCINEIKAYKPEIDNFEEIPNFIENIKMRVLRESLAYARLLRNKKILKNNTILNFWSPSKKGIKKKCLYFCAEVFGKLLSKSNLLLKKGDTLYEKEILFNKNNIFIEQTLLNFKPDIVLNLHQRSPLTAPIVEISKKLKIKLATVIFSWDNVPKARLISRYDFYFVWSSLMKKELNLLYPDINEKQIKITGTPQFEFYQNEKLIVKKETFFNEYNLDLGKKTVCFSGDDVLTSPNDPVYLEAIAKAITSMPKEKQYQILFRRCPVDLSGRYDDIVDKYSNIIKLAPPIWNFDKSKKNKFTLVYPKFDDIKLLVNTVKHCDVVINLGSTMAHDFAVLNKPAIYLNYDVATNNKCSVKTVYNFQHFRSMKGLQPVFWLNNEKEILNCIYQSLNNSSKVIKDSQKWLNIIANQEQVCFNNVLNEILNE
ncbi:hypothetical protein [uncultured Polaribacter sp.]|uniref:hypothetical protein n=1 Tax=uncultured Polaribacter sp. TaxID=174711 RepID=UPI00260DC068|nr:hypothetical protein [uncultured Polaribacter sp.]